MNTSYYRRKRKRGRKGKKIRIAPPSVGAGFIGHIFIRPPSGPSGFNVGDEIFEYRRKITITEKSGKNLEDYNIRLDFTSSNFDFSAVQKRGEDIRFTDHRGNLLDYYIEQWNPADEKGIVWVRVPNIASLSTATLYMYYGNSSVTSLSNGSGTWLFFDDFKPTDKFALLGVFTDVHASDQCNKPEWYCAEWQTRMSLAISKFNEMIFRGLHLVVSSGDFIDEEGCGGGCSETKDQILETLQSQASLVEDLQCDLYYCLGNHELRKLTKAEFMNVVGMEEKYYYVDINDDFRVVVLDAQFNPSTGEDRNAEIYGEGYVPEEELDWLANVALNTTRKCIVFSHQLLCDGGGYTSYHYVSNRSDVRSILEAAGNVIAVVQGHIHADLFEIINGIPYFAMEAMVDGEGLSSATYALFWAFANGEVGKLGERGTDTSIVGSSSPNPANWSIVSGSWKIAGFLQGYPPAAGQYARLHSKQSFENVAIRWKQQSLVDYTSIAFRIQDENNYYYYHCTHDEIRKYQNASTITIMELSEIDETLLHTMEVRLFGTHIEILCDDEVLGGVDDGDLPESGSIGFLVWPPGKGAQMDVCVRKYTSPEPEVVIGSEETS
ncbi:MAG: hypothetical protein DRJ03_29275 [Chloroflexi bacterium]|nr:MAG: hypothetical protein DRJ03_29275 [Chloroflexota bacterium]